MKKYAKKGNPKKSRFQRADEDINDALDDPTAGFILIAVTEHEDNGVKMISTNWFGAAGPNASNSVRQATYMIGDLVSQTVAEVQSGELHEMDDLVH